MEEARDAEKKRSLAATSSTAADGVGFITDDLIVDILSRVPVKSICRFKCVSPSWRDLISHPDNRKKLPQTLTGLFYFDEFAPCTFVSLAAAEPPRRTGTGGTGRRPPPSPCDFLPPNTGGAVVDCCNGLVLLNNSRGGSGPRASYVVCNPATKKWTTVPGPGSTHAGKPCFATILCFDPAVSAAHFHVVRLLDQEDGEEVEGCFIERNPFDGFHIYSSETGAWVFHPQNSHWSPATLRSRRTFFDGLLHFITDGDGSVAALDMKGQTRSEVRVPRPRRREAQLIGHSQGRLLYACRDARNASRQSIYVLGENGRWTLKHSFSISGLFTDTDEYLVEVAAIHPHGDSVFVIDSLKGRLMSYGMGSRRGHVIPRGVDVSPLWSFEPYVPLYLEMAALENSN